MALIKPLLTRWLVGGDVRNWYNLLLQFWCYQQKLFISRTIEWFCLHIFSEMMLFAGKNEICKVVRERRRPLQMLQLHLHSQHLRGNEERINSGKFSFDSILKSWNCIFLMTIMLNTSKLLIHYESRWQPFEERKKSFERMKPFVEISPKS